MGVVGIWGPGIFSDDVADDVREEYRELLGDDVPDEEATRQILAEYLREPGDETTVWLALAATQTGLGRLDDNVKAKALELFDSGAALTPWLEGTSGSGDWPVLWMCVCRFFNIPNGFRA